MRRARFIGIAQIMHMVDIAADIDDKMADNIANGREPFYQQARAPSLCPRCATNCDSASPTPRHDGEVAQPTRRNAF